MAFDPLNLSVLAYANGFTLWHYKSAADAGNAVDTADYFLPAKDIVKVNDVIIYTATDRSGITIFNSNTGASVDVADGLVITATDTR